MPLVAKKVLSRDADKWLLCCWDTCENQSVELHKTRFHDHARGLPCSHPDAKHPWYTFCSERHKQFFLHSHIAYGKLPPGFRLAVV